MSPNNFGFSAHNNDDDDSDDDNRRNNDNQDNHNPFGFFSFGGPGFGGGFGSGFSSAFGDQDGSGAGGASSSSGDGTGGLGDILSQFGQMLSGMGSSMNSPDAQGPVNFPLAERIARQAITSYHSQHSTVAGVRDHDTKAVEEAVRLAELWLDDATSFPTAGHRVVAWDPDTWLTETLPMWKRLISPVAEGTAEAELSGLPEELQGDLGPMKNMIEHMSRMHQGMNLGNSLGDLAPQALSGTDFGLPLAPAGVTAIMPQRLAELTSGLNIPTQEALVYLCAREAARQRLFTHIPYLTEMFVSSVEEFAAGLVVDKTEIDDVLRSMDINPDDPMNIQDLIGRLQESDLTPRITSNNAAAISRPETLLALIEGWVDLVVTEAMGERMPSTAIMNEAWQRRRTSGGSADNVLKQVVGIDISAPRVDAAKELWRRVGVAVGTTRRDAVWNHPDFLPVASDIDSSAEFIDGLLSEGEVDGFDPIAEIDALEKMLAEEAEKAEGESGDTDDNKSKGDEEEQ